MKKKYIIPTTTAITLRTHAILVGSPTNTYGDNEGLIRFKSNEVSAENAD
jgi:hypothetical protein